MGEIIFRKNIVFNIKISAHDFYDLEDQFGQIIDSLRLYHDDCRPENINICSSSGYTVEGTIDPQWSKERYEEELMKWFEKKKRMGKS